jgi:hypothetical protein
VLLMHLLQLGGGRDEVVVQHVVTFWEKAMASWLPVSSRLRVSKAIADFLLTKSYTSGQFNEGGRRITDFCLTKLPAFVHDSPNVRLVASWILDFENQVMLPLMLASPEPPEVEYPPESLVELGVTLTIHHLYLLCKALCGSIHLSKDEKQ